MISVTAEKSYEKRSVLEVDALTFEEGKRYAIVGANGSGKTTLLKIMGGVLKANKFVMSGSDSGDCCYMPQQSFCFSLSVRNNVLLAYPESKRKNNKGNADKILRELGLIGLKRKNASRLSGGETQRVALARSLIKKHALLLLDEPTASMDIESSVEAENIISKYCKENACTLIFSTHSYRQAERLADEVIFMCQGKVIERGTPEELLHNPKSIQTKAFLEFFL